MKIANIVLSVLVLLAAAVSAVFSYFLYEKRVTFVTGWEQLTSAIYDTAANLDRNSGTKVAQELTADKLAHKNYDEAAMNSSLGKLRAQSKNIVSEAHGGAGHHPHEPLGSRHAGGEQSYLSRGYYAST